MTDIRIKVEQCIDSELWVWSLLDSYNGVRCDGYADTEQEAWDCARRARTQEIAWLNGEQEERP